MAHGSHTILFQIVMQAITILLAINDNWEKMINALFIREKIGKRDKRIVDVFVIVMSHMFTLCIIFCKILKFYIKNCSLNFVKTAITTRILEDILALTAIVGERTNSSSQL